VRGDAYLKTCPPHKQQASTTPKNAEESEFSNFSNHVCTPKAGDRRLVWGQVMGQKRGHGVRTIIIVGPFCEYVLSLPQYSPSILALRLTKAAILIPVLAKQPNGSLQERNHPIQSPCLQHPQMPPSSSSFQIIFIPRPESTSRACWPTWTSMIPSSVVCARKTGVCSIDVSSGWVLVAFRPMVVSKKRARSFWLWQASRWGFSGNQPLSPTKAPSFDVPASRVSKPIR